ncbi:MAG TPA: phosphonate ABC transporter, permease protein PhnE [Candidatus Binatia bacterium]|nr:phosphonate ABC transporter, permease protein PhnE [Candidatus Binatia bacterium]
MTERSAAHTLPPRFRRPRSPVLAAWIALLLFLGHAAAGVGLSPTELITGLPHLGRILSEMFPPDLTRIDRVAAAILETFQMALVGTALGIVLSFFLAVLASRTHSPSAPIYFVARSVVSLFRTVPDLVWALLFVVAVGLGPFAGTLAITIDTIGFCGRFFAEAMEEAHQAPQEALRAVGARWVDVIFCSVMPAASPSFINSSLFSLEKATRSSVILGLVGAGGIGIELKVAMELFNYSQAATAILAIFILVIAVEQTGAALRRRLI